MEGLLSDEEGRVRAALSEGFEWLEENDGADAAAFRDKQSELYDMIEPILAAAAQHSYKAGHASGQEHDEL